MAVDWASLIEEVSRLSSTATQEVQVSVASSSEKILDWIEKRGGKATARDLQRRRFTKTSPEAKVVLKSLAVLGYGVCRDETAKNKRKIETFYLK